MQAVVTVTVSVYSIGKNAFTDDKEGTVMTGYHFPPRLICFFFLFTAANDKRYLTLYKLVISTHITIIIIIIIINKLYATVSDVADENIDAVGNLHK